jgi:GTP-binding protein EngB required for normal cell division
MRAEIIFAGRSNVGKSSIVRCLTGRRVPVGRRPGVTRKPLHLRFGELTVTDMPGFGFMSGWDSERVKDEIVYYIEDNAPRILLGFVVLDAKSFLEIVERCERRGEIPVDLEMYDFLVDVGIDARIVANKIDKVEEADRMLDAISEKFNLPPPWQQWRDIILPASAKKKEIQPVRRVIREKLSSIKREDMLKHFPKTLNC